MLLVRAADRGADHFAATAQMNREHLHAEVIRGFNCSRDGVGNVVKLQIEPDLCTGGQNRAHNFRSFGCVKLEADFEKGDFARGAAQRVRAPVSWSRRRVPR